jgi:hypothetical protein
MREQAPGGIGRSPAVEPARPPSAEPVGPGGQVSDPGPGGRLVVGRQIPGGGNQPLEVADEVGRAPGLRGDSGFRPSEEPVLL